MDAYTRCDVCEMCPADTLYDGSPMCYDCRAATAKAKAQMANEPGECINCGADKCEDALCKADAQAEEEVQEREDDDTPTTFDYYDDAEALASAGWGTDEDYGYYGGED